MGRWFESIRAHQLQAMSFSVSTLLNRNLHDVVGENDSNRRRAAMDEIYTDDVVFYESNPFFPKNVTSEDNDNSKLLANIEDELNKLKLEDISPNTNVMNEPKVNNIIDLEGPPSNVKELLIVWRFLRNHPSD